MNSFINRIISLNTVYIIILLMIGNAGCSSGSSTYLVPEEDGEIVISLTDAAGNFSNYTVDVLSLNLTKANGTEVAVLPLSTRIDFAQYTETTEFLTAATVPAGIYVAAHLTLDFSNAEIFVEDESGDNVPVTDIIDEYGDPLATLELSVELEDQNSLTIKAGIPAHLMLDFDLQASNRIRFDENGVPTLTVDPFLVAEVNRADLHKIHRIRGLLHTVNMDANSFSVVLRPFYCALSDNHRLYGTRSVITDTDTIYHINGEVYEGYEGLAALNDLNQWTPVAALGALKFNPLRFEAWEVYAGTSVPGASLDVVSGWVTQITGDILIVRGASLMRSGATFTLNDNIPVQVADTTVVTRQISSNAYSKNDISVGQHITAFGTLINEDPENLAMDAADGMVRMMITTIRGTVVSVNNGILDPHLVVELQSIGKFRAGIFNFEGTGPDSSQDADPNNYRINTGTMELSGIFSGSSIKIKGFAEPFGTAPPDFSAYTIIDVTGLRTYMRVNWAPATDTPFTEMSSDGLRINLEGTGRLHHMIRGGVVTDLYDLSMFPLLVADINDPGMYILKYDGTTEIYTMFENFVLRITELLRGGYVVRKTNALGRCTDALSIMTANVIEIHFETLP